jgi:mannose-6-phosphate isomerase-like protein (cupin superfamily)
VEGVGTVIQTIRPSSTYLLGAPATATVASRTTMDPDFAGGQHRGFRDRLARVKSGVFRSLGEEKLTDERCFILESWNDASDPAVSVARARVPPGVTTARHSLSVDERYLVVSGRGRVEVEDLEPVDVSPGDVVLIPAGKTQRIRNLDRDDLVFLCICTPRFEPRQYRDREESP